MTSFRLKRRAGSGRPRNTRVSGSTLGGTAGISSAGGYVEPVEVQGAGIGALRIYHLTERIGAVVERLIELNEAERTTAYDMVDYGPLNWADYSGHIKVTPAGPDACIFVIRTRFQPFSADDAGKLAEMSRANIGMYIANLREAVLARG